MKTKKLLFCVTLVFGVFLVASYYFLFEMKQSTVDIVKINDAVKTVEKLAESDEADLTKSGEVKDLSYELFFKEDENYSQKVNEAVEKGWITLDLDVQGETIGKIAFTDYGYMKEQERARLAKILFLFIGAVWAAVVAFVLYLYMQMIRPFRKMQYFARSVAEGNLDLPLDMQKNNYFGAFTESFDLMREELKRARQAEYEANKSKKELVAQLSHDIKTPVSTIKAICELIEAKTQEQGNRTQTDLIRTEEQGALSEFNREKIKIIYRKADIIDKLISDMFHATLEELEMLKIMPQETGSTMIGKMLEEINHYGKIHFQNELPKCLVYCDELRLSQVIDNVVSNSYKYADTDIWVEFLIDKQEKLLKIKIKDLGEGAAEEELPLITQKYYRGSGEKVKNTSGSGLGMYLAKLFMEGMRGSLNCYNEGGFVVEIGVRIV
ncbi:HAMP domain-containing sensor histidine kinase [Konateibacter massiliensis]|uniref:HAMP domain-containing sensor histidine kinase n=1 Tax=Konateibacter massiliensis TaxID=2002841 RepID=UPI000C15A0E9|nr:HAMP domain-containing sensor histidine kinase [Konateibacter massiliensis]